MNNYLKIILIYVFIILIIFLWIKYEKKDTKISRYEWIILLFSGLGGFALLMTVYYQIENSQKDRFERHHNLAISKIKAQKEFFMTYLNDINFTFPESSELYFEIFYRKQDIPKDIDKNVDKIKKDIVVTKICLELLQVVDNFIYLLEFIDKETLEKWLGSFLLWFRSSTLKSMFNKYLFMFGPITIDFIKNIIELSTKIDNEFNNTNQSISEIIYKYIPEAKNYLKNIKLKN